VTHLTQQRTGRRARSIGALPQTGSPEQRREVLKQLFHDARVCERCPQLAQTRTQVVFGAGNANADILFVGEAPGEREDAQGVPFVGAAGKLLSTLLEGIGLQRDDVFIANVLKCRPPQNRDPHPQEIERCEPWLWRQIELIEPTVVVTLGRYASGLLRGEMAPLGAIRGRAEVRILGTRAVRLLPVLHPAAALYRREPNLRLLEEDFALIPGLLQQGPPEQPPALEPMPELDDLEPEPEDGASAAETPAPADDAGVPGADAGEPDGLSAGSGDEPAPEEQQLGLF
jgi:uracil-DNA glycosylase